MPLRHPSKYRTLWSHWRMQIRTYLSSSGMARWPWINWRLGKQRDYSISPSSASMTSRKEGLSTLNSIMMWRNSSPSLTWSMETKPLIKMCAAIYSLTSRIWGASNPSSTILGRKTRFFSQTRCWATRKLRNHNISSDRSIETKGGPTFPKWMLTLMKTLSLRKLIIMQI